jgi:S-methylmethionine-dependent homocysteine/selenocysteine methylase/SAM-dependent methyltransferase
MSSGASTAYQRIQKKIAEESCVILDGGTSTELERMGISQFHISDDNLWGTWGLFHAPYAVLDVHRRYVGAGADIITTDTWGIVNAPDMGARPAAGGLAAPAHWMDVARSGIRLARQAIDEAGKTEECAVAFSVNGDVEAAERHNTLELLTRVFENEPPDLILMETLSLIRDNLTFPAVEIMLATGIPVWLSFRRCRHGVCGVYGQHWGGPEGDLFGRAVHRFEKMGVAAVMINCLPINHLPGMLPWLKDFTDLPLGVYPNLGHYLDPGWQFDDEIGAEEYAKLALQWREEGAEIIGGCCGVGPEHIAAAGRALNGTKPGRPKAVPLLMPLEGADRSEARSVEAPRPWLDERKRSLYPLPFPDISVDSGVFRPTQGSFLVWKNLFESGAGKDLRCLDVGCGSGVLTVQLALNGARHVHAIDVQSEATINTLANAFRNGVSDRVTAEVIDLFTYRPEEEYDLVAASLYQMPVDPLGEITGHRLIDFWGRNLLDHLIKSLPRLLAEDGVAYVMQISILGQLRTAELFAEMGLTAKVVDYAFFQFSPIFYENIDQIWRVEQLSDAYHLKFGEDDVMVMYLLEVKRTDR